MSFLANRIGPINTQFAQVMVSFGILWCFLWPLMVCCCCCRFFLLFSAFLFRFCWGDEFVNCRCNQSDEYASPTHKNQNHIQTRTHTQNSLRIRKQKLVHMVGICVRAHSNVMYHYNQHEDEVSSLLYVTQILQSTFEQVQIRIHTHKHASTHVKHLL